MEFRQADAHSLASESETFDIVHAHQTLQHVGDPVAVLREMRRVRTAAGVVAARDADYGAFFWYPEVPGLQEWRDLYRRVAQANGGAPDAGRRLHAWARAAGFREVRASASNWCFATPEERAWWSELWADRTVESDFARAAVEGGHASWDELRDAAAAWRDWGRRTDGWFVVPHGEVLCWG